MGPRPTGAHLISWAVKGGYYSHRWNVQGMSVTVRTLPNVATLWEGSCALSEVVRPTVPEPNCIGSQKVMSSDLYLFWAQQ